MNKKIFFLICVFFNIAISFGSANKNETIFVTAQSSTIRHIANLFDRLNKKTLSHNSGYIPASLWGFVNLYRHTSGKIAQLYNETKKCIKTSHIDTECCKKVYKKVLKLDDFKHWQSFINKNKKLFTSSFVSDSLPLTHPKASEIVCPAVCYDYAGEADGREKLIDYISYKHADASRKRVRKIIEKPEVLNHQFISAPFEVIHDFHVDASSYHFEWDKKAQMKSTEDSKCACYIQER